LNYDIIWICKHFTSSHCENINILILLHFQEIGTEGKEKNINSVQEIFNITATFRFDSLHSQLIIIIHLHA